MISRKFLIAKNGVFFSQLYHLAIKAEREVQGRKQHQTFRSNNGRNFEQSFETEMPTLTPVFSSGVSKLSNVQPPQLRKVPLQVLPLVPLRPALKSFAIDAKAWDMS